MERITVESQHVNSINGDLLVLLGAIVLILVLVGVADLFARNAETNFGGKLGLVVVLLLVASLPIWGTLLYLVLVSLGQDNAREFWGVAPWLVFVAYLKFGGIFFTGAIVCGIVYGVSQGTHRQKWARMQLCMVLLVVGATSYAALVFAKSEAFHF